MKKLWIGWIVSLLLLAGGGSYWLMSERRSAAASTARWKAMESELREKLAAVERARQSSAPDEPAQLPASAARPPEARLPQSTVDDSTTRQSLLQMIEEKDRQLTSTERDLRELQTRLHEVSTRLEQVLDQQGKLQTAENQLRERLDSMTQQTAAQEASVKAKEARLVEVEQSNQELRRKTDDSAKRIARLRQIAGDFDELARRREAFLTNILGRYREATDLFRTMSVRLDQPREGGVPVGGANDVSRIQNAISLAEEDLRQLRNLNTRASALQKDLREVSR